MSLRVGVAALGLFLSGSVFSAVTITAPEEIVILAVNGQEVNNGLLASKKNNYQVDPGNLTVNVRYREYFEHLNGEHDIVKSGVVTLQATELKDNQSYVLGLVNAPKSFEAAKKYAEYMESGDYDKFVDGIAFSDTATEEEVKQQKEMILALLQEKGQKSMEEKGGLKKVEIISDIQSNFAEQPENLRDFKYSI